MHSTMKSKSIAVAYNVVSAARPAPGITGWRWFVRLMLALHASRRKAARREIARYHDLIDLERRYDELERRDDLVWRRGTVPFQGP
jgi:hypothetical protein